MSPPSSTRERTARPGSEPTDRPDTPIPTAQHSGPAAEGGRPLSRRHRPAIPVSTRLLGLATMLVARTLPALGARLAYRLWFRTVRPAETGAEFATLGRARRWEVTVRARPVVVYDWGRGPVVFLVHGWGSHAGRMTPFVDPLLERGYRVVAPDLPAHGRSAGRRTDIFELRDALLTVGGWLGPDGPAAVVAHSLGTLAYLTAARAGLETGAMVLVSPAIHLDALVDTFEGRVGLSPAVTNRLMSRLARFVGNDFYDGLLEMAAAALVIHDRDDDEIPHRAGRAAAAALPRGRLMTTEGLGHNRILQDPAVVAEAMRFLTQGGPTG